VSWRLLVDDPSPAHWNMAVDEALMEEAEAEGRKTLRLYAWSPPALSFGRNEPATRRYDRKAIVDGGLAVTRRPTGGRAVWHSCEVTYSVAAPASTFGSLRETYQAVHRMLVEALRSLGAAVRLAPARPAAGVGAGACFSSAAGGEVVAEGGGKVVGSAQVRSGAAFLQHGSILLVAQQQVVRSVTVGAADLPDATGLLELVYPRRGTFEAVSEAVARAAGEWGVPSRPGSLEARWLERARELSERYADPAWIWRR
jgi:lipoate-protein ligase A